MDVYVLQINSCINYTPSGHGRQCCSDAGIQVRRLFLHRKTESFPQRTRGLWKDGRTVHHRWRIPWQSRDGPGSGTSMSDAEMYKPEFSSYISSYLVQHTTCGDDTQQSINHTTLILLSQHAAKCSICYAKSVHPSHSGIVSKWGNTERCVSVSSFLMPRMVDGDDPVQVKFECKEIDPLWKQPSCIHFAA